jgi:beta-galactosidase
LDLGEFMLRWKLVANDSVIAQGSIDGAYIGPQSSAPVTLPLPSIAPKPGVEHFLNVRLLSLDHAHGPAAVAWEQFRLPTYVERTAVDVTKTAKITRARDSELLTLTGEARDFAIRFDLERGELVSYSYRGVELIESGPVPNFWRPPTDNDYGNDMPRRQGVWRHAGRDRAIESVEWWQNSDRDVEIYVTTRLPVGNSLHVTKYHVFGNGEIVITNSFTPGEIGLPDLPKFGMTLTMPAGVDRAQWYGRGPYESYVDRKIGSAVGVYSMGVDDMYYPYIRPQENGNRSDVRWIALRNGEGIGLLAVADSVMEVSALRFDDSDFDEGDEKTYRHAYDVQQRDHITLDLDYRQMGLGGDTSWGAVILPQYRVPASEYSYRVRLMPFGPGDPTPMQLSKQRF